MAAMALTILVFNEHLLWDSPGRHGLPPDAQIPDGQVEKAMGCRPDADRLTAARIERQIQPALRANDASSR